jgi:hypothetical protein
MEEHKVVKVKVSPKQLSKLRNGHKVRVKKPEMEGDGVSVIVNPANYDIVTRSFSRNKGVELALSPPELMVNKEGAASMAGNGIFGKKFDKFVKKTLGKKGQKILYGIAKEFLPVAQAGIDVASLAATPFLGAAAPVLGQTAKDYLENPKKYQGQSKGKVSDLAKDYLMSQTQDLQAQLQSELLAKKDKALAGLLAKAEQQKAALAASAAADPRSAYERLLAGNGLYAGSGLYAGAYGRGAYMNTARRLARGGDIVGARNSLMTPVSPALQSQPYGANYQFRITLPPAYQK